MRVEIAQEGHEIFEIVVVVGAVSHIADAQSM